MTKHIRHAAIAQRLDHSHVHYATNRHWPGFAHATLWQRIFRISNWHDRERGARLQGGHYDSPNGAPMKMTLDVKDRKEADAIRTGMEDPAVKAFVVVMGALASLPSDRARERVLTFVADSLDEHSGQAKLKLDTPTS